VAAFVSSDAPVHRGRFGIVRLECIGDEGELRHASLLDGEQQRVRRHDVVHGADAGAEIVRAGHDLTDQQQVVGDDLLFQPIALETGAEEPGVASLVAAVALHDASQVGRLDDVGQLVEDAALIASASTETLSMCWRPARVATSCLTNAVPMGLSIAYLRGSTVFEATQDEPHRSILLASHLAKR
jgi:hypothetical protein